MNKAGLKKILRAKRLDGNSLEKDHLLRSITKDINRIGVLTVGVSYSKNDNLEFLELYSRITKTRAEYLKRAVFINEKQTLSHSLLRQSDYSSKI